MPLRHDATGLRAGKAVERGAPSQKTCRSPAHRTPRGREDSCPDSCSVSSPPARCSPRSRSTGASGSTTAARATPAFPVTVTAGERQGHRLARPAAHRLAVGHRDRVALRDRRRLAGRRGRRPVGLPEERPEDDALRVHAERRGDRRLPARSRRRRRTTRRASSTRSAGSGSRCSIHNARRDAARRLPADPPARHRHRASVPGAAKVVARMKARIAKIVASTKGQGPRPERVPRARRPTCTPPTSNTFIGRAYAMLGLRNIADAARRRRHRAIRSSRPSTSSRRTPT